MKKKYRIIMWTSFAFFILALTLILIAVEIQKKQIYFKVSLIIGFSLLILFSLMTSYLNLMALYKFYNIVKSIALDNFKINYAPIVMQTVSLGLWTIALVLASGIEVNYYNSLDSYDNAIRYVVISDFSMIINMFSYFVLAYLLFKMSKYVKSLGCVIHRQS